MIIMKILDTSFTLLNCVSVGDQQIHFYFAYEHCYGTTWFMTLFALIFIIFVVSMIFFKRSKMSVLDRQNSSGFAHVLVNKYKPQYYYWEYLLFIRRVIIALFCVSINDIASKCSFLFVLALFTHIQSSCNPFIIDQCDTLEHILLLLFIFITTLEIASAISSSSVIL